MPKTITVKVTIESETQFEVSDDFDGTLGIPVCTREDLALEDAKDFMFEELQEYVIRQPDELIEWMQAKVVKREVIDE